MRAFNDCTHCYLKQMLSVFRIANMSEDKIRDVMVESMMFISTLDNHNNPSMNSSLAVLKAYEICGNYDPFHKLKVESNDFALGLESYLGDIMSNSEDRFWTALKISVAGNIIDAGITPDFDINIALNEITTKEFDHSDYDDFGHNLESAKNILILGDNSGEIVFDKFIVNELRDMGKVVTYAVKSHPCLNDATREDVEYVGMDKISNIVYTGSKFVGATLEYCSKEFVDSIRNADIIVAKGQANYESLDDNHLCKNKTYFVLRAKCQCIANHLGVKLGSIVIKKIK
jgi:damage-control phosphatase, subfamily I